MKFIIGMYSMPVLFSYIGLVFSIISCYMSQTGNFKLGILFLILAGIIDSFDGKIARKFNKNEEQKKFGIEIDSILDVVSFVITPIVILFKIGFNKYIDLILFIIYAFCGTMRLAYFNTYTANQKNVNSYIGLPVTSIALFLPIILFLAKFTVNFILVVRISILIISMLYILKFEMKKIKNIYLILVLILLAISMFVGICICF